MDTLKQLNSGIIKITIEIKEQFPELSKYILEMPVTIPNIESPEMNRKALQEYYDSLKILLEDYNKNTSHKSI